MKAFFPSDGRFSGTISKSVPALLCPVGKFRGTVPFLAHPWFFLHFQKQEFFKNVVKEYSTIKFFETSVLFLINCRISVFIHNFSFFRLVGYNAYIKIINLLILFCNLEKHSSKTTFVYVNLRTKFQLIPDKKYFLRLTQYTV